MSVDSPPDARNGFCEQGILEARGAADPWVLAMCLKIGYSYLARADKDPAFKAAMLREAIAEAERCGDPYLVAETTHGMGDVYFFLGDHAAAEPWFRSAVRLARAADHPWLVCDSLWQIARGYVATGRLREGKGLLHEGLRAAESIGARGHYDWYLRDLAQIARLEHTPRRCLRLLGGLAAMQESAGSCPAEMAESLGLPLERAEAEWSAGRGMSADRLIAYALSDEEQATGDPA
jgi:hypothetical protein